MFYGQNQQFTTAKREASAVPLRGNTENEGCELAVFCGSSLLRSDRSRCSYFLREKNLATLEFVRLQVDHTASRVQLPIMLCDA